MKPILIRPGSLTNRIWAIRRYTQRGDLIIASAKNDVTYEAIRSVVEHTQRCESEDCECRLLRSCVLPVGDDDE